ncbi:MAG: hypothetical protein AAGA56_29780, partial [Myxococcota bacterium]
FIPTPGARYRFGRVVVRLHDVYAIPFSEVTGRWGRGAVSPPEPIGFAEEGGGDGGQPAPDDLPQRYRQRIDEPRQTLLLSYLEATQTLSQIVLDRQYRS